MCAAVGVMVVVARLGRQDAGGEEDDENESEQHNQHDGHQAQRHLDVLPEVLAVHLSRRLAERVRLKQAQSCRVRNHHSVQ